MVLDWSEIQFLKIMKNFTSRHSELAGQFNRSDDPIWIRSELAV